MIVVFFTLGFFAEVDVGGVNVVDRFSLAGGGMFGYAPGRRPRFLVI